MRQQMIFARREFKYLLTRQQQQIILSAMRPYMVPDEYAHSSIRNLYLDTPEFHLIRRSLEAPVYKEKLRIRSYGWAREEEPVFVELKKKYRSVVYKRRIFLPQDEALACLEGAAPWPRTQIAREIAYSSRFYQTLSPMVFLSYERDAYHARDDESFRVTFDTQIRFRREYLTLDSEPWGAPVLGPDQVLMELKVSGGFPLWMARVLSEQQLFKVSFSKYGTAYQRMPESSGGVSHYA